MKQETKNMFQMMGETIQEFNRNCDKVFVNLPKKESPKQERMYSEEEVLGIINKVERFINKDKATYTEIPNWFVEEIKKF